MDSTASRERHHTLAIGVGAANVLDTYLSPMAYDGTDLRLVRQTERRACPLRMHAFPIYFQTQLTLLADILQNPARNIDSYAGGVRYTMAWLTPVKMAQTSPVDVMAGPMLHGYLGGVYNDHGGNNPAQAKADITLDATATVGLSLRLFRRPCRLVWQMAFPLVGAAFSPNFGQSYYEIFSKGEYDHNVVPVTLATMPSLRTQLMLDVPVSSRTDTKLRIGFVADMMQARINNLRYHSYTQNFMIGFSHSFLKL